MLHVLNNTTHSSAKLKSSERELIRGYGRKPGQGDWKCVMMEKRNSNKGQSKQDKIEGNSQDQDGFDHGRLNYDRSQSAHCDELEYNKLSSPSAGQKRHTRM